MRVSAQQRIARLFEDVKDELNIARNKFPPFNSEHEGYAVIKEEVDELWDDIKNKDALWRDKRNECIQIAAMAIRFIIDREDR